MKASALRFILISAAFFAAISPAQAVVAVEDRLDLNASYAVLGGTETVIFVGKCEKDKFAAYKWHVWPGNYSVRAFASPIADVVVSRELTDPILDSQSPFIEKAIESAQKMGGNIVCAIKLKRTKEEIGLESMTFRIYRQFFQGSYAELENYYQKLNGGKPVSLQDIQALQQDLKIIEDGKKK